MSNPLITDPSERVDYSSTATPRSYVCKGCGKTGVKLWRNSGGLTLDGTTLLCADCAAAEANVDISTMDASGRFIGIGGRSDQFPRRVPATPTEDNDGYWYYTATPEAGCDWWTRLPVR